MKTIGLVGAVLVLAVAMVAVRSRTAEHRQSRDVAAQAVPDNVKTVTLKVPKMDCAGCEIGVKIAASRIDGVKETRTDSDKRTAHIVFDASITSAQAIASAITSSTGFDAEIAPTK
jgi:mercuric ion binding protein